MTPVGRAMLTPPRNQPTGPRWRLGACSNSTVQAAVYNPMKRERKVNESAGQPRGSVIHHPACPQGAVKAACSHSALT
eukprot:1331959-Pyramimonas_sp.AAC.1